MALWRPCWGLGGGDQHPGGSTDTRGVPGAPPFTLAAPQPCSQLSLRPKGPHPPVSGLGAASSPRPHQARHLPPDRLPGPVWLPASCGGPPGRRRSPSEDQAEQGAEEDQNLVEHG